MTPCHRAGRIRRGRGATLSAWTTPPATWVLYGRCGFGDPTWREVRRPALSIERRPVEGGRPAGMNPKGPMLAGPFPKAHEPVDAPR
jgi:hypothetical protein